MAGFGDFAAPYLTMAQQAPAQIDRLARLGEFQRDEVQQRAMQQPMVDVAPQIAQAKLYGSPWDQSQFAWNYGQKGQALDLERLQQQNALRHNLVEEDLARQGKDISAYQADPFGMHPELHGGKPGQTAPSRNAPTASPQALPANGEALPGPTGEDFLKTLPIPLRNMVNGIRNGDLPPPSANSRSPVASAAYRALMQVDPNFTALDYQKRHETQTDFTKGTSGQNALALSQAALHLQSYRQLTDALQNGQIPMINDLVNRIRKETGDEKVTNPRLAMQALGSEIGKTFKGAGVMGEKDAENWVSKFSTGGSPEQMRGAVQEAANLLSSRRDLMEQRYKSNFYLGKDGPRFFDKTYPGVNQALDAMSGGTGKVTLGAGNAAPAGGGQMSPQDQAAISWARANANDPRAQKILNMHGQSGAISGQL